MRGTTALIAVLWLAACGQEAAPPPEPIVLYAPATNDTELTKTLERFTEQTGVGVSVKWGLSGELTDAVIANSGVPADVLMTDNANDIWRAAEEGALRPATSPELETLPAWARDADAYWLATAVRYPVLLAAAGSNRPAGIDAIDGRVCLSDFSEGINRTFVAFLIHERGVRDAERLLRRWMRRLDGARYASDAELHDALLSGRCDFALLPGGPGSVGKDGDFTVAVNFSRYPDVRAAGVGRHARQPQAAQRFLGWLASTQAPRAGGDDMRHAAIAGDNAEAASLLAERIGWN